MNDLMTQCTLFAMQYNNMPTRANELVGSVVQSQCSTRMETIRRRNTQQSPQTLTSATVAPFDQLKERINAYQESIRSTPPRRSPTQRFGRTQYDVVTRQCEIAMGSVYGQAFHFRCRTYLRQQEFLFRVNVQEHFTHYSTTPTFDYNTMEPSNNAIDTLMGITVESDNSNEDGFEIPLQQRSPESQNIALAHIY